jgi:hypothetical protein
MPWQGVPAMSGLNYRPMGQPAYERFDTVSPYHHKRKRTDSDGLSVDIRESRTVLKDYLTFKRTYHSSEIEQCRPNSHRRAADGRADRFTH